MTKSSWLKHKYFLWLKFWGFLPIAGGALGDGDTWDETNPSNSTLLSDGDDHIRDIRKGVRIRLEYEHATLAGSSVGGKHKFITLQAQATKPTLDATQVAAVYCKTVSGVKELFYEDSAAAEVQLTTAGAINVSATPAVPTGTVLMWGAAIASPPTSYLACDGSAVSRTTYAALFTVVASTWGSGDGSTTFNLPNFTNKFPYGASEGASAGNSSVAQTSAGAGALSGNDGAVTMLSGAQDGGAFQPGSTSSDSATRSPHTHNVMPPYLAICFIIKT